MKTRKKQAKRSVPVCVFCHRSGAGVVFAIFAPRFQPFGTACIDCESTLPKGTVAPVAAPVGGAS